MGIERCMGKIERSGKHRSRFDVGTMSGMERQFEGWTKRRISDEDQRLPELTDV
jgi:hypothetical protein